MKNSVFINLLQNPAEINQQNTVELKSVIEKHPYFQSVKALYLKGLKNQESFKYNNELKITAAFTTDRTMLFEFITSDDFNKVKKVKIHEQVIAKIEDEKASETTYLKDNKQIEADLEIGEPLSFSSTETHSFGEWLQLSSKKPIIRGFEESAEKNTEKKAIIERFISNNPKIIPVEKGKNISISVTKNTQEKSLMTETLAKVYLEQRKYENAIQAYRILSLKYPEKSGYFADQIKKIQILQK